MSTHGPQIMSDVNIVHMDLFWVFEGKKFLNEFNCTFFLILYLYINNSLNIVDFKNMKFFFGTKIHLKMSSFHAIFKERGFGNGLK